MPGMLDLSTNASATAELMEVLMSAAFKNLISLLLYIQLSLCILFLCL
jgi:hypothetical protein